MNIRTNFPLIEIFLSFQVSDIYDCKKRLVKFASLQRRTKHTQLDEDDDNDTTINNNNLERRLKHVIIFLDISMYIETTRKARNCT